MAFAQPTIRPSSSYTPTDSGCRIHRATTLRGLSNIVLQGKAVLEEGVVVRGDLQRVGYPGGAGGEKAKGVVGSGAVVGIGRWGYVGERSVIRPAMVVRDGGCSTVPFKIGEYVRIGSDCIVQAASIGMWVVIGDGCIIGNHAVLKDGVHLDPGSVVPPGTNLPAQTRWAGNPARMVEEMPEASVEATKAEAEAFYNGFRLQR